MTGRRHAPQFFPNPKSKFKHQQSSIPLPLLTAHCSLLTRHLYALPPDRSHVMPRGLAPCMTWEMMVCRKGIKPVAVTDLDKG